MLCFIVHLLWTGSDFPSLREKEFGITVADVFNEICVALMMMILDML
jgi:hypothetical protein